MRVAVLLTTVAGVPLNWTLVAPVKSRPVMVTDVPTGPRGGVKSSIRGAPGISTLNWVVLLTVPSGVVTRIGPVVAPAGTVAHNSVSDATV